MKEKALSFQISPLELYSARLAHSRAAASFESKMATTQHEMFFAFVSSLKSSRRLLCSVRFVFVSTFNLQRGRAFVVGITKSNFEIQTYETESIFINHPVHKRLYDVWRIESSGSYGNTKLQGLILNKAPQCIFKAWCMRQSSIPIQNRHHKKKNVSE